MKTDVTIYTQVYNTKPFLERCLSSVMNQTLGNFDYILVDNGCTDGSSEILRQCAERDPRVKLIRLKENCQCFWLSMIKEHAKGQYVAFLDSDDWWEPDHLERLLHIAEGGDFDIVCTGTMFHKEGNEAVPSGFRSIKYKIVMDKPQYAEFFPYYHAFFRTVWGKLIRWKTLLNADVSIVEREQIKNGSDTLEAFAWLRQAERVCIDNSVLHHYLIRNKSVSHVYLPNRFKSNTVLHQDALDFLLQYGPVSKENLHFLHIIYANAVSDTLDVLWTSDLTPKQKLEQHCAIAAHPITQETYADTDEAISRSKDKLRLQMLSILTATTSSVEQLPKVLKLAVPNCASAFTSESIGLVRLEPTLLNALRQDDRDALAMGLLNLIEMKRYTKQYDLELILRSLADVPLLREEFGLSFLRKYREIYWMLWQEHNEDALDAMTGLLMDGRVKRAAEPFLQLYLNTAAQLEHIPAFLFGKTALAQYYLNQGQTEQCRAIVQELDEMGMEDNDILAEIRQNLASSDRISLPQLEEHRETKLEDVVKPTFEAVRDFDKEKEALVNEINFS